MIGKIVKFFLIAVILKQCENSVISNNHDGLFDYYSRVKRGIEAASGLVGPGGAISSVSSASATGTALSAVAAAPVNATAALASGLTPAVGNLLTLVVNLLSNPIIGQLLTNLAGVLSGLLNFSSQAGLNVTLSSTGAAGNTTQVLQTLITSLLQGVTNLLGSLAV